MAYEAGAKYVLVFNYELNGQGILTDEHFNAMKQFWDNIHSSTQDSFGKSNGQVAFVLPTNYGWGMRHINDRMWGLWDAPNNSSQIWDNLNKLTDKYGLNLRHSIRRPKCQYPRTYTSNVPLEQHNQFWRLTNSTKSNLHFIFSCWVSWSGCLFIDILGYKTQKTKAHNIDCARIQSNSAIIFGTAIKTH